MKRMFEKRLNLEEMYKNIHTIARIDNYRTTIRYICPIYTDII